MSVGGVASAGPSVSTVGSGSLASAPDVGPSALTVLYDQNGTDSGIGLSSQNFETANDVFDTNAADDFLVPNGVAWKIQEVSVTGVYYNGVGLAVSQNVTFYKHALGLPGAVVATYNNVVGVDDGLGSFRIKLPTALKLKKGHYWVSVQVNMDFPSGGQWAWENQTTAAGSPAAWRNPGNGFATGCTVYAVENVCAPSGQGDHIFKLRGAVLVP